MIALTAAAAQANPTGTLAGSPSNTPPPTLTATLVPATALPDTPTASLTPDIPQPEGAIRIVAPGPMSKIVSPLKLIAYVIPGGRDRYQVELLTEDGTLLARRVDVYRAPAYTPWVYVSLDIPFEIPAAAELARLQISTLDDFGRPLAVMSVHVLLQSSGLNVINPSGGAGERAWLTTPSNGMQVTGGEVRVEGKFRPFTGGPLVLDLLGEDGGILGTRVLALEGKPDSSGYLSISTTVPYNVNAPTPARLTLRQADDRINGLMYLYSLEVLLTP